MTHSAVGGDGGTMRTAAFALACLMSAAAATSAAAGGPPVFEVPPFRGGPPPPPPLPRPPPPPFRGGPPPFAEPPLLPGRPSAEVARPPRGRVCFTQAETRDKIIQRRLADPLGAMRAGRAEGEALRTRLCRWRPDELVYEVYVLRRDGRIIRLYMNAENGQAVGVPEPPEHK